MQNVLIVRLQHGYDTRPTKRKLLLWEKKIIVVEICWDHTLQCEPKDIAEDTGLLLLGWCRLSSVRLSTSCCSPRGKKRPNLKNSTTEWRSLLPLLHVPSQKCGDGFHPGPSKWKYRVQRAGFLLPLRGDHALQSFSNKKCWQWRLENLKCTY